MPTTRTWYTQPHYIRHSNFLIYCTLAIAAVLAVRLAHGTVYPWWHAAGLLLCLTLATASILTAFLLPGEPLLRLDGNGIHFRSSTIAWRDYRYATIDERPAVITHAPRPWLLTIRSDYGQKSIPIARIGYRSAQDIVAACQQGKAQYNAQAMDDTITRAYRDTLANGDFDPTEQAELAQVIAELKNDLLPSTTDSTAALRAEIQQETRSPATREALLRLTRYFGGKADTRPSYPLRIRPLAWLLLAANGCTALAIFALASGSIRLADSVAEALPAYLVAISLANLIAWRAPWRWQAVSDAPPDSTAPRRTAAPPHNVAPHQWYKHPRAVARGNWHTFAWLLLTALLAMLTSRGVANGHPIALALLLPILFSARAAWQAARHALSQHAAPLVRLDGSGVHLALKNRRKRRLGQIPARGTALQVGALTCHIAWEEIAYIGAEEASRYHAQRLLIEDQTGDNHGILTAPLGDYERVCAIAATARTCLDTNWPAPDDEDHAPPHPLPLAYGLFAANTVLIAAWLTLNLLVQQGALVLPFADPSLPWLDWLPPLHLHSILPFGAYPHANTCVLLALLALNLAARFAPWQWQAAV